MAKNLLTPILQDSTLSVNFFNGRLLSGEDLTAEQESNRMAHRLIGQAVGSGVAYGLEVGEARQSSTANPVLTVTQGLAINRNGGALLLDQDTDVSLACVETGAGSVSAGKTFQDCIPTEAGPYIAGARVYMLLIAPASATQGLAEVMGISTATAPCNTNVRIDGVQFRLVQLDIAGDELADVNHLQNLVAYKCFGVADWAQAVADPLGTPPEGYGLVDQLRGQKRITKCEVPLAVLYWTATGGVVWVDMWSVRRPLVSRDLLDEWAPGAGHRRFVEGLAMFLQFQEQLQDLLGPSGNDPTIQANKVFRYLPPVGLLPITGVGASKGVSYPTFLVGVTVRKPQFLEGARLDALIHDAFGYPPIDLNDKVMVWQYWIRENMQTINTGKAAVPNALVLFASGHMRNYGHPHFDVNRWDYSTYA